MSTIKTVASSAGHTCTTGPLDEVDEAAETMQENTKEERELLAEIMTSVKTQDGRLSFVTTTKTKNDRWLWGSNFDVPREPHGDGIVTGQRIALELMRDIKAHPDDYADTYAMRLIVEEAMAERNSTMRDEATRRGAATGFIDVLLGCFSHMALETDFEGRMAGIISQQIILNRELDANEAAEEAEEKAQRKAASAATRKAKKANKAAVSERGAA